MDVAPLAALAGLVLLKEAGLPIPVPGDLLVLGTGVAASGRPEAPIWLMAILVAGYIGGTIQFLLFRGAMRPPLLALLTRLGVPRSLLDSLAETLRMGGVRAVAVARSTPGVRMAVVPASGIAALPMSTFLPGLIVGNTVFVSCHFALGFVLGKPALAILSELNYPIALAAILVALAAAGAIAWVLILRRRWAAAAGEVAGATPTGHEAHATSETGFAAWEDAACPICLALAAVRAGRPEAEA
jgi:membrane protein DedA with SNARE-associated domain